ncbi:cupin domain-containing protein [Micromonospora purpureochromogenes]|uniref:cupin domain-containing protein n=1 Tax=Micromonospora TaxID=1873 RepID=UPI001B3692D9|nr:cupin domain-containing protein [Micromonospora sp. U56]MBQ0893560.1 cupin domain-containing protein [Micromonospora sp. U56]
MTHLADATAAVPGFHPATDAEEVTLGSGSVARFVAPGRLTQGRFGLFEWRLPPHTGGTDTHLHRTFSESFYVTAGTIRLYDGRRWVTGRPGDFLHVPEGRAHGYRNETADPAAMLVLFAPGAPREAYFRELAEIGASGRTLSDDEWVDLWARHDQYRVDPADRD